MGKIIEFRNNKKYINLFINYEKTGYVKDIVNGLKFLDSIILKNQEMVKKEFSAILYFYEYFNDKYENNKDVRNEIKKKYKNTEPLILLLAENIIQNTLMKNYIHTYESLPKEMKRIVNIITENIYNINQNKGIIIIIRDENNTFKNRIDINIDKNIDKKNICFEKEKTRYYLSLAIKNDGFVALLTEKNNKYTIRSMSIIDYKVTILSENDTKNIFFAENAIYKKWEIELEQI